MKSLAEFALKSKPLRNLQRKDKSMKHMPVLLH